MKGLLIAAAVALALVGTAANAQQQNNQTVNTYFGIGNSSCCWSTSTADGLQIGLKAQTRGVASALVPVNNVYTNPLGSGLNVDFSIDPSQGYGSSLNGLTFTLQVTDLGSNVSASFDPTLLPDNSTTASQPGAIQNSEYLGFGFLLGSDFNANANDTYKFLLVASGAGLSSPLVVTDYVNEGTGLAGFAAPVPEPASWALMIIGLGFVGATMRSRRVIHA